LAEAHATDRTSIGAPPLIEKTNRRNHFFRTSKAILARTMAIQERSQIQSWSNHWRKYEEDSNQEAGSANN